jgi:primosomal replication protein N
VNQLVLSACIVEASAMRYTPAGLPAIDMRLEHGSDVQEAGQARQVKSNLKAVAIGSVAERLVQQPLGLEFKFTGFISSPRNSKQIVFHIQDFQNIS